QLRSAQFQNASTVACSAGGFPQDSRFPVRPVCILQSGLPLACALESSQAPEAAGNSAPAQAWNHCPLHYPPGHPFLVSESILEIPAATPGPLVPQSTEVQPGICDAPVRTPLHPLCKEGGGPTGI